MIVFNRGAWLIPRVLAAASPFANIIASEVVGGYGDHKESLLTIKGGRRADNFFRLHTLATVFIGSDDVRELRITGHADRVWSHGVQDTADEDRVSQFRADDAWDVFQKVLAVSPGGAQMLLKIAADEIGVLVVGLGARRLLYKDRENGPENRRVELELSKIRSTTL